MCRPISLSILDGNECVICMNVLDKYFSRISTCTNKQHIPLALQHILLH